MVLDLFSRGITDWMMSGSLRTELVLAALEMAVQHRDTELFAGHRDQIRSDPPLRLCRGLR
jgi:transposase InsO family protein